MIEIVVVFAVYASCAGWCYWRYVERSKRRDNDQEYWDKVRRECPNCGTRRKERENIVQTSS